MLVSCIHNPATDKNYHHKSENKANNSRDSDIITAIANNFSDHSVGGK
jgi:PBP1b-binding outer membrane lipoprotein LpoB